MEILNLSLVPNHLGDCQDCINSYNGDKFLPIKKFKISHPAYKKDVYAAVFDSNNIEGIDVYISNTSYEIVEKFHEHEYRFYCEFFCNNDEICNYTVLDNYFDNKIKVVILPFSVYTKHEAILTNLSAYNDEYMPSKNGNFISDQKFKDAIKDESKIYKLYSLETNKVYIFSHDINKTVQQFQSI